MPPSSSTRGAALLGARPGGGARAARRRAGGARLGDALARDAAATWRPAATPGLRLQRRAGAGAAAAAERSSTCARTPCSPGSRRPAVLAIERHLGRRRAGAPVPQPPRLRADAAVHGCGWVAPCRDCDARLTVHQAAGRPALPPLRRRCTRCPARCPQCGFAVKAVGQGTERIEEALAATFPAQHRPARPRRGAPARRPRGGRARAWPRARRASWSARRW